MFTCLALVEVLSSSAQTSAETKHLRVTASASADRVHAGQRISLTLDIELKPDMHVYAPSVEGYIPIAWSLAPNDAFIMDSLGWAKYRQGNSAEAASILKKAYDLQPNAEIGAHLGEVQWKAGQQDQARDTWRQAQKLEPGNDTLVKTLKRFQVNDL